MAFIAFPNITAGAGVCSMIVASSAAAINIYNTTRSMSTTVHNTNDIKTEEKTNVPDKNGKKTMK